MSSLPGLTAQANSIANCSPQDCCNQIAALSARIAALENKPYKDHSADIFKIFALLGTLQIGLTSLGAEVGILGAAVAAASGIAAAAAAAVAGLGAEIGAIAATVAGLVSGLAALAAAILPLLGLVAVVAALGLTAAAAQIAADSAYSLADTALRIASNASAQAGTAILRSGAAQAAADTANRIGSAAQGLASAAQATADRAIGAAGNAQSTADRAIGAATAADNKAVAAGTTAAAADNKAVAAGTAAATAQATADSADLEATGAFGLANRASDRADRAQSTADKAINSAGAANTKADRAISSAGAANTKADRAIAIASSIAAKPGIQGKDGAIGAQGIPGLKGDRGLQGAAGLAGSNGLNGFPGIAGSPGKNGLPGSAGTPGAKGNTGATGAPGATGAAGANGITTVINQTTVNPGKEDEIINLLKGTNANVLAVPGALIASTPFRAAAISAAAAGSCQSSRPGGCPGGGADQIGNLGNKLNGIGTAVGLLNNQILGTVTSTLNVINTKLGSQIVGGLSAWSKGIAEVVNKSQILNVLTYISVLHNAYMLSNSLSQTLFSAVGNSLAALGLKDTSVDPAGTPFNVGKIVGDWTETFFKSVFGVATVNGIKADWTKYSRIYQAAANLFGSIQSIGYSIISAVEIVGNRVARIGNALQRWRVVSDKAYQWMNPNTDFHNPFFTSLEKMQAAASSVDQIAASVLSTQESIKGLTDTKAALDKSLSEKPEATKAPEEPKATVTTEAEKTSKTDSESPEIESTDKDEAEDE
jgi:hypothetical protein